ncbi:hypothetical protein JXA47_02560 [Candidatus Sumerlaeota bacterium]|nr:hypothetical protein [Candidatus Sumerlaeota bacterium]
MTSSSLTYARTASLTLSPRCVNQCGFCPFPLRRYRAVPSLKRWRQWLRAARPWEPTTLHITGGEPLTKDRDVLQTVRYYGHSDAIDYLGSLLAVAQEEHHGALLPSLELGELRRADLQRLRHHIAEYVVGIVPFDPALFGTALLWNAPTMVPPRRLDLIQMLGQLRIPTTINMLIGLGECESSRLQTLAALAEVHARRGHLQWVRITPFQPHPETPMENHPAPDPDEIVRTVRQATEILGAIPVQVPALDVADSVERCVDAGAQDLGPVVVDPAHDLMDAARRWGEIERRLIAQGHRLVERLPLTESSVARGMCPETLCPNITFQLDRLEARHVHHIPAPARGAEADHRAEASA